MHPTNFSTNRSSNTNQTPANQTPASQPPPLAATAQQLAVASLQGTQEGHALVPLFPPHLPTNNWDMTGINIPMPMHHRLDRNHVTVPADASVVAHRISVAMQQLSIQRLERKEPNLVSGIGAHDQMAIYLWHNPPSSTTVEIQHTKRSPINGRALFQIEAGQLLSAARGDTSPATHNLNTITPPTQQVVNIANAAALAALRRILSNPDARADALAHPDTVAYQDRVIQNLQNNILPALTSPHSPNEKYNGLSTLHSQVSPISGGHYKAASEYLLKNPELWHAFSHVLTEEDEDEDGFISRNETLPIQILAHGLSNIEPIEELANIIASNPAIISEPIIHKLVSVISNYQINPHDATLAIESLHLLMRGTVTSSPAHISELFSPGFINQLEHVQVFGSALHAKLESAASSFIPYLQQRHQTNIFNLVRENAQKLTQSFLTKIESPHNTFG